MSRKSFDFTYVDKLRYFFLTQYPRNGSIAKKETGAFGSLCTLGSKPSWHCLGFFYYFYSIESSKTEILVVPNFRSILMSLAIDLGLLNFEYRIFVVVMCRQAQWKKPIFKI